MEKIVQDHEKRIIALEEFQIQTNENIEKLQKSQEQTQNGMLRLENVVLTSTKETRDILQPFADHYLNQIAAESAAGKDVRLKRLDMREKIIIGVITGVCGTGGAAGLIVGIVSLYKMMNGGQ